MRDMTTQLTALAAAIVTVLTLGVGAALAAPPDPGSQMRQDTMHTSEPMRAMHDQMPADMQADCDAMHAQMPSGMGSHMGQMHRSADRG